MHNLEFEKIIDKIESKYDALVAISIIAKKIADGEIQVELGPNEKVTMAALKIFMGQNHLELSPSVESK